MLKQKKKKRNEYLTYVIINTKKKDRLKTTKLIQRDA